MCPSPTKDFTVEGQNTLNKEDDSVAEDGGGDGEDVKILEAEKALK